MLKNERIKAPYVTEVDGEPEHPVSREVLGLLAPMSGDRFRAESTPRGSGKPSSPIPEASCSR